TYRCSPELLRTTGVLTLRSQSAQRISICTKARRVLGVRSYVTGEHCPTLRRHSRPYRQRSMDQPWRGARSSGTVPRGTSPRAPSPDALADSELTSLRYPFPFAAGAAGLGVAPASRAAPGASGAGAPEAAAPGLLPCDG